MMTTWFISRHPGAWQWAQKHGVKADRQITHLAIDDIQRGDTIIGSLPVNIAAQACKKGARYIHLTLDLPAEMRGRELTAEQLEQYGAMLQAYHIEKISHD